MRFITIAALFLAGALAVPTSDYYGGNNGGNNGGDNGGDNGEVSYPGGNPGGNDGGNNGGNDGGNNGGDGGNNGGDGGNGGSQYEPCTSLLNSSPQCCATDVLGLLDLNCSGPNKLPTSPDDFESICAGVGKAPQCCLLPIAGQSLVCQPPVGI